MSSPVINNPAFQDGIAAVTDSIVTDQNNAVDYLYSDDGIGDQGVHEAHADPAGQALGSRTQASGFTRGPLKLQLVNAADSLPSVSDILLLRGGYYKVAGPVGPTRVKNKAIMFSVPAEKVINPLITTCLGSLGQIYTETVASGGGTYTKTFAAAAATLRSGATKVWSVAAWTEEYPTATVPAGMSMASSTGILTYTTPSAGTYYLKITCKDTVTGKVDKSGVGFVILTVT